MENIIEMTLKDAKKLGFSWDDFAEKWDLNKWALNEGLANDDTYVKVPVEWLEKSDKFPY